MNVLIKKYVPEKYWASDKGPIRCFDLTQQKVLTGLASKMTSVTNPDHVQGMCIDINELVKKEGKDNFTILISDDILLEDHMVFTILHEVGHVDWHFNDDAKKFDPDEAELYADFYAFERIRELLGMDRALDMVRYCSANGLGKSVEKKEHVK